MDPGPDVTLLNMPGTMPNPTIQQATPQRGRQFLSLQNPVVPTTQREDLNPVETSLDEIEGMTRIIADQAQRITEEAEATISQPETGIRLVQPRLPNPVAVILDAIKEGLISLHHSTLSEMRRGTEPALRNEQALQQLGRRMERIHTSSEVAQNNGYHATRAAEKAQERVEALEEVLKEVNKVLGEQGRKLSDIREVMGAIEQWATDTANTLEALTKHLQDTKRKEQPIPSRRSAGTKTALHLGREEEERGGSDDEDIFGGESGFIRESTAHPKKEPVQKSKERTEVMNQTTTAGSAIPKEARTKRPEPFNRKKGKEADAFITRMDIYFDDYEGTFSDLRKISSTLMNMGPGESTNWAQPLLRKLSQKEDHEFIRSWKQFKTAFLLNFSDPVKKDKAIQELGRLTQVKSAQGYASQFRILIQEVEWNQDALINKFKAGLKPEVRKELLRLSIYGGGEDLSLEDWIALACCADDMMFANKQLNAKTGTLQPAEDTVPNTVTGKATQFSNSQNKGGKPTVRVSDEEKQQERKEGLCIKCAKPGHMIKECQGSWIGNPGKTK